MKKYTIAKYIRLSMEDLDLCDSEEKAESVSKMCIRDRGSTAESSAAGSVSDTEKIKQQYNNDYNDK